MAFNWKALLAGLALTAAGAGTVLGTHYLTTLNNKPKQENTTVQKDEQGRPYFILRSEHISGGEYIQKFETEKALQLYQRWEDDYTNGSRFQLQSLGRDTLTDYERFQLAQKADHDENPQDIGTITELEMRRIKESKEPITIIWENTGNAQHENATDERSAFLNYKQSLEEKWQTGKDLIRAREAEWQMKRREAEQNYRNQLANDIDYQRQRRR